MASYRSTKYAPHVLSIAETISISRFSDDPCSEFEFGYHW